MSPGTQRGPVAPREAGLGILAARLLTAVQDELYTRLEEAGYGDVTRLHGAVMAHLDDDGTRATELARRSGRHKQIIVRIVDELEALDYVERYPEPADRRAKLVVPTARGRELMAFSDEVIRDIEQRLSDELGPGGYTQFRDRLASVVETLTETSRR